MFVLLLLVLLAPFEQGWNECTVAGEYAWGHECMDGRLYPSGTYCMYWLGSDEGEFTEFWKAWWNPGRVLANQRYSIEVHGPGPVVTWKDDNRWLQPTVIGAWTTRVLYQRISDGHVWFDRLYLFETQCTWLFPELFEDDFETGDLRQWSKVAGPIFSDVFEAGDLRRWSRVVPEPPIFSDGFESGTLGAWGG